MTLPIDPAIGAAGDIDTAVIVLRDEDGCMTVIDNSRRCAYGYDQRVEAFGTKGMAMSDNSPGHGGVRRERGRQSSPSVDPLLLPRPLHTEPSGTVERLHRRSGRGWPCARDRRRRPRPAGARPGRPTIGTERRPVLVEEIGYTTDRERRVDRPAVMERSDLEVLTIGRIGVDLYAEQLGVDLNDVRSFRKSVSRWTATNVAVAVARLGHRAAVFTRIGDDPMGGYVRTPWSRPSVSTSPFLARTPTCALRSCLRRWKTPPNRMSTSTANRRRRT